MTNKSFSSIIKTVTDWRELKCISNREENDLILGVNLTKEDWKKKFETLIQEFTNRLSVCYLFEKLALDETADIDVSKQLSNDETPVVNILKPVKK